MILRLTRKIKSLFAGKDQQKNSQKHSAEVSSAPVTGKPRTKTAHERGGNAKPYPARGERPGSAAPEKQDRQNNQNRPPATGSAPLKSRPRKPKPKGEVHNLAPQPCHRIIPSRPEILMEVPPEEGKVRFADLPISEDILYGIQTLGFKYCTPIQAQCLIPALEGRDVTGKALTGTGKTAAFLISSFTRLMKNPIPPEQRKPGECRVLILAPTRELAMQIHKDAEKLSLYHNFHNLAVFGGMGHKSQRDELNRPVDILVGTPGRIIDYCSSGALKLEKTEILVIDEADRMLDMGFIPDVKRIVSRLPKVGDRQTMFFSATLTDNINNLIKTWLKDPVQLETESECMVTDLIDQRFYAVPAADKFALLLWILEHENVERMLIFVNRKDINSFLTRKLASYDVKCESLSGDVPQQKRIRILEDFRNGDIKIIVATDVAARGIHVDGISHVVNYELPDKPEDYVHRIGRTGRAGNTGDSISFVCEYGAYSLPDIEAFMGHAPVCIQPEENMIHLDPPFRKMEPDRRRETRPGGRSSSGGGGRSSSGGYRNSSGGYRNSSGGSRSRSGSSGGRSSGRR